MASDRPLAHSGGSGILLRSSCDQYWLLPDTLALSQKSPPGFLNAGRTK